MDVLSNVLGRLRARGKEGETSTRASRGGEGILGGIYLGSFAPVFLLVIYGMVVIWSASLSIAEASFSRHLVGVAMGLVGAAVIWRLDYRILQQHSTLLFATAVGLILLPMIPGLGVSAKGMTGWVKIPLIGLRFQPSELVKIITIFLMAARGAQYNGRVDTLEDYITLCAPLVAVFGLMITQDLGTGLIILVVGATIVIVSGARRSWVLMTIGLIVAAAALVVGLSISDSVPDALHLLKPYQLNRLIVFVDPSVDPAGEGYNLQQAKIAVGSGGLFGKGIGNASQAGSGFLPEAHTDFVFALLAEEFGFVGSFTLLALFGWAIFAVISLAQRTEAPFGKLILAGVAMMWAFQVLQNIGMCIGIMPITGIPLPFISFGSTSMVVQLLAAGIVQSVWRFRSKVA